MIWLKVFLLSCLGGRAGGWPSSPSGDLREAKREREGGEKGDRNEKKSVKIQITDSSVQFSSVKSDFSSQSDWDNTCSSCGGNSLLQLAV